MPRYELALILKAMQRVSDLPFRTCLPARAPPRPLGHRPSSSPHGREEARAAGGGRAAGVRTEGARLGWPARRGRVRAGGGGVPARERGSAVAGGCASQAAGQVGGGAGPAAGVLWKVRGRTRASARPRSRRREAALSPAPPSPAPPPPAPPPPSATTLAPAGRPGTVRVQ